MNYAPPRSAILSGGRLGGGVASFAEALSAGFRDLGIATEVISPKEVFWRQRELRDPTTLKIFSTSSVFAAPLARRSICVAHGFPRADAQGWAKLLGIISSFAIANKFSKLVAVSHYSAVHLQSIFNLRVDAVIHNPLHSEFLGSDFDSPPPRDYITYVGRLHPCKRLDRIFPAICELVAATPGLRACIVGDGELRGELESYAAGNERIEFKGALPPSGVRSWLRRSRVFVSGCETEAFGIAYLEALSQGCVVVMPACGGGLEIAPQQIGSAIQLLPLTLRVSEIRSVLRHALTVLPEAPVVSQYGPVEVARAYLDLDRQSFSQPQTTLNEQRLRMCDPNV